jgi:hypothetical protein
MKKILLASLLAFVSATSFASVQSDIKDLDDRVFDLEEKLGGKYPFKPIDAQKGRFGGVLYHDQRIAQSESYTGKDSGGDVNSFTRIDLMVAGDLNDDLSYLFVPAWFYMSPRRHEDTAARETAGKRTDYMLVYRGYMKWDLDNKRHLKIGRFLAPFGAYISTYSPSTDFVSYWPQNVSPTGGITFTPVVDGIQYACNQGMFDVKLYAAIHGVNGGSAAQNPLEQRLLRGTPDKHLYGGRFGVKPINMLDIGLSVQAGERYYGIDMGNSNKDLYGKFAAFAFDAKLNMGKFVVKAEYMKTNEEAVTDLYTAVQMENLLKSQGAGATNYDQNIFLMDYMKGYYSTRMDSNKTSYYIEPSYRINQKFMIAFRYDYVDYKNVMHLNKEKSIYRMGLNYFVHPKFKLMFNVDKHDYKAANASASNPFYANRASTTYFLNSLMNPSAAALEANPDFMEYGISATMSF